ncbi:hypothetical protein JTB14_005744 [Gonioctena quinquepunctata]|nr:hypothetical protein JTB14_005744 [Gonioctena quinquepunctata]
MYDLVKELCSLMISDLISEKLLERRISFHRSPHTCGKLLQFGSKLSLDERARDRHKFYADAKRNSDEPFELGDLVWVTTHALSNAPKGNTAKFYPKRDGPYRILRKVSPGSFEITTIEESK